MNFNTAYKIGKRKLSIINLYRKRNLLLSLDELISVVKPLGERYSGMRDIKVDRIIGSENRSGDFAMGFFPLNKWMEKRWNRIKDLLTEGLITEPILVFEYGGYYFVRDGNHRVSVAKTNKIEYLNAEITELKINVKLCENMNRHLIPLFIEKNKFYNSTKLFDYIPEENFFVSKLETWDIIKDSIFRGHKEWFVKKNGYEPDNDELCQSWNIEIYETTMEYISMHHLPSLTRGRKKTDVFCDLMNLWETMPEAWFADVFNHYVTRIRRYNFIKKIIYYLRLFIKYLSLSVVEERALFFQVTRIMLFRPNAYIPSGNKYWYRFLHKQIMVHHFKFLKKKFGRNPYMHELTGSWYDDLFEPALKFYKEYKIKEDFSAYYMKWMKSWRE